MRGSPPVQLAFLLLVFLGVGIPLVQLTHGHSEPVAPMTSKSADTESHSVFLRVRYSQKPVKLALKYDGEDLLPQGDLAASPVETQVKLQLPVDGLELAVSAAWPAGTPDTALTIEMEPDGLAKRSETLWSMDGQIDDIAFFTWKR